MSSSGGSTKQQSQEALLSELDSIMALLDAPVPAAQPESQPTHDDIPVLDTAAVPTLEAEVPVLEAEVPVLDAEVSTLEDDIPVLGEVAATTPRAAGPSNRSGSELDTIVELLIERRLPQIRQQLHDELLAELQDKLGL